MNEVYNFQLTEMPDGYEWREDGIYLHADPEVPDQIPTWLCSPVKVMAVTQNQMGNQSGRMITGNNRFGEPYSFIMNAADIGKVQKVVDRFRDYGLDIDDVPANKKAVSNLLLKWKPEKIILLANQIGWADNSCRSFILNDGTIVGKRNAVYVPLISASDRSIDTSKASIEKWKDEVAGLAVGNKILIAAISLAFVGPLLRFTKLTGFGLHLIGNSSTGKTTALTAATSVWGDDRMIKSWRTTSNALESVAAGSNDNFLPLDELGEVAPKDLDKAIYMLANGQGRHRAGTRGQGVHQMRWRTVFLSTGELSVSDKLREAKIDAQTGQVVRMMDVRADGMAYGVFDNLHGHVTAAGLAKQLNQSCGNVSGVVGPAFIEALITKTDNLYDHFSSNLEKLSKSIIKDRDCSVSPHSERVAKQFAMIAMAGETATNFGLTGWVPGTALNAACALFKLWLAGQIDPLSEKAILLRISQFLQVNGHRLKCKDGADVPDQIGWQDANHVMFDDKGWSEIHPHQDRRAVTKAALAHRIVLAADGDNLKAKAPFWVPGRPRLHIIQRAWLSSS